MHVQRLFVNRSAASAHVDALVELVCLVEEVCAAAMRIYNRQLRLAIKLDNAKVESSVAVEDWSAAPYQFAI